jgi:hypothetical protein
MDLMLMLGAFVVMSMAAVSQESPSSFNLLDGEKVPTILAEDPQGDPSRHAAGQGKDQTQPGDKYTTRDQEMVIRAGRPKEEALVGPYQQSEWTQHRRFGTTRIYVQQPPGGVEFEHWLEVRIPKAGAREWEVRMRDEFEFGLGNRIQLDLYLLTEFVQQHDEISNTFDWRGWSAEIRYALADWNVIPGNPTLYFEYIFRNNAENFIEPKLLLGGEFCGGLHWGLNFVYERELGNSENRTEEYKLTGGLSFMIIDQKLSIGPAFEWAYEVEWDNHVASRSREFHAGPSIQIRPIPKAHINIEPLWGFTGESKRLKMFIIFGWDF